MDTTILGKTGLRVTVAGLGCGGFSRLGINKYGEGHAAGIVRAAYDAGVNFFDTAVVYGTEGAVGAGLEGAPRDGYVLSTKYPYSSGGNWRINGADMMAESLNQSLRKLKTDYVDIYHLHGVIEEDYKNACEVYLPAMLKAKEQGKIRFFGITELFGTETSHKMMIKAVRDDLYDVVMVGYNMLNPSAARTVFPAAAENNTGALCMFAVRSALSNPEQLAKDLAAIINAGQGGEGLTASPEALDFITSGDAPAASTLMDAAYRFCRHTPPIHVVLTGTGSADHLRDNLRSINGPPLPGRALARLHGLFGRADCISGQ